MSDTLQAEIQTLIAEIIEVDPGSIHPDTDLRKELGADSMSALEIMAVLEDKYSIVIKPDRLPEMATLARISKLVAQLREGS